MFQIHREQIQSLLQKKSLLWHGQERLPYLPLYIPQAFCYSRTTSSSLVAATYFSTSPGMVGLQQASVLNSHVMLCYHLLYTYASSIRQSLHLICRPLVLPHWPHQVVKWILGWLSNFQGHATLQERNVHPPCIDGNSWDKHHLFHVYSFAIYPFTKLSGHLKVFPSLKSIEFGFLAVLFFPQKLQLDIHFATVAFK